MNVDTTSAPCCPAAGDALADEQTERLAALARALGDPVRVQLVHVLRARSGELCQCELAPLFDVSQPTLSHHLRKLREAGIVTVERRGVWAYYSIDPESLKELSTWLS